MAEICVVNIGRNERKKRRIAGYVFFPLSVIASAFLIWMSASPAWQLALAPLFLLSGLGFFQAREKT